MFRTVPCWLLLAATALGAAPPLLLAPEQVRLLRERPWFGVNEKTLEIELRVYGPWHRQVEKTAVRLGNRHLANKEWKQAARCFGVAAEARLALDGAGHWGAVDARWAAQEAQMRAGW